MRAIAAWLPILAGCNVSLTEDEFLEDYANHLCQRGQTCLWQVPADPAVCRNDYTSAIESLTDGCLNPDWLVGPSRDCLREVRTIQCDQTQFADPEVIPTTCQDVYECESTISTL